MNRAATDLIFVLVPKVLTGACTVICNMVLLRFLGPEPYGSYALCLSMILVFDATVGSALDLGTMRLASANRDDARLCLSFQAAGVVLKLVAGFGMAIALLYARSLSLLLFHRSDAAGLLALTVFGVLALMMLRSVQMNAQIQERFSVYGFLELMQLVLRFGGIAVLLVLGKGTPATLLACAVLGPFAASLLWIAIWGSKLPLIPRISEVPLKELLRYVKWYLLTFSVAALASRADLLLVTSWSNLEQVGLLSAAQAVSYAPQLIGAYLAVWISPKVMPAWREGRFFRFFKQFQTIMAMGCVFAFAAGVAAIKVLGPWLLPKAFLPSQKLMLVLLPGSLAGLLSFPLTLTFLMFVRPKFLVLVDCLCLPVMLSLYRYAIHQHGAAGAAWVTSVGFVAKALIAQVAAWKLALARQEGAPLGMLMRAEGAGVPST